MFKTGSMYVFRGLLKNELVNALSSRNFDKAGMPEKTGGEFCYSHICDSLEYMIFRLVMSDPDFEHIKQVASLKK
jgi:hypothetical protein